MRRVPNGFEILVFTISTCYTLVIFKALTHFLLEEAVRS